MSMPPKTPTNTTAAKLRRAQEASEAIKTYEAERLATRAKTERLRAERLEREAASPPAKRAKKR
jgi:hypothetical protein